MTEAKVFDITPNHDNFIDFEEKINDWLKKNEGKIKVTSVVNGNAKNYGWGNGERFIVIYNYEKI
jgi:hypothetical protein